MAKENFQILSTNDLIKKKKSLSFVTGILAGILIVLLISAISLSIKNGFSALVATPFALSPILIMNYQLIKKIKEELKSRN